MKRTFDNPFQSYEENIATQKEQYNERIKNIDRSKYTVNFVPLLPRALESDHCHKAFDRGVSTVIKWLREPCEEHPFPDSWGIVQPKSEAHRYLCSRCMTELLCLED